MFPSHCRIKLVSVAVASALSAIPLTSQASGFALIEQNASGLGNAYSGAAAAAEDASTIYFNPAGMSLLPKGSQFSIGLNYISPAAKFNNSGYKRPAREPRSRPGYRRIPQQGISKELVPAKALWFPTPISPWNWLPSGVPVSESACPLGLAPNTRATGVGASRR